MSKVQRIGLALFILATLNLSNGAEPVWFSVFGVALGWLLFTIDNIAALGLRAIFYPLFGAGWIYRRVRGMPEPARHAPE